MISKLGGIDVITGHKAYIVANGQQEREVLEKLEQECLLWHGGEYPTEFMPSKRYAGIFPYSIFVYDTVYWNILSEVEDEKIVFDGRKGSKMKISKEVYDALAEWRDDYSLYTSSGRQGEHMNALDLFQLPSVVESWWFDNESPVEINNHLIAIIRWVNGEDVFEVEKPKKWVVRSKDSNELYGNIYFRLVTRFSFTFMENCSINNTTKFDTKEEAESWANAHQEVVEVNDD